MRPSTAMLATLCAVTMMSCIGDDDGDPSNYVGVSELKSAYKDAACTYFANCGLFPTKDACIGAEISNLGVTTLNLDANVVAAIGAGRVYYNGSNVKACFEALGARSCDKTSESYRAQPPACRNVITGTQPGGASCTIDEECVSQQCSSGNQGESCAMGVCVGDIAPTFTPAMIGETCSSSSGCVAGAYCDNISDTCMELKSAGTTCMLAAECAYGLSCVGVTGSRTCGTLPGPGESCATDGICRDDGNWCNFSTTSTCEQVGTDSASCSSSSSQCSQFYPCDFTTTTCKQGPGLGEACDSFSKRCFQEGTFCDSNTSMCVGLKSNGMDCNSDAECSSDFCDQSQATPLCANPTLCF